MSKPIDFYWTEQFARTLAHILECAKSNMFSCKHRQLIRISLQNVVLDELHLMLRVTGQHFFGGINHIFDFFYLYNTSHRNDYSSL
jgi:hypothetical protein